MPTIRTNKGNKIFFDKEDYSKLANINWEEGYSTAGKKVSVIKRRYTKNGKRITQSIARYLLGDEHESIDHINRNIFDNRKKNLRICTHQQNSCNRTRKNGNKYRGVYFEKRRANRKSGNAYRAIVVYHQKPYYAGYFPTEVEAAEAYNKLAIKLHGDFAYLNKLPSPKKK